jgi:hypothetical protein
VCVRVCVCVRQSARAYSALCLSNDVTIRERLPTAYLRQRTEQTRAVHTQWREAIDRLRAAASTAHTGFRRLPPFGLRWSGSSAARGTNGCSGATLRGYRRLTIGYRY